MVFTILRVRDGKELFRRFSGDVGFFMEHPDVVECDLQQCLGDYPERMEGSEQADDHCLDLRYVSPDILALAA